MYDCFRQPDTRSMAGHENKTYRTYKSHAGDSLTGQGAVRILALPTFRRTSRTSRTSPTIVISL